MVHSYAFFPLVLRFKKYFSSSDYHSQGPEKSCRGKKLHHQSYFIRGCFLSRAAVNILQYTHLPEATRMENTARVFERESQGADLSSWNRAEL